MSAQRHVLDVVDDDLWSRRAADVMAAAITAAVERRGRCLMAISGGSSPLDVFDRLAGLDVPWADVTIVQVDERVVPPDSPARNLAAQFERLGDVGARWLPLPVDALLAEDFPDESDLNEVAAEFLQQLTDTAGDPPVFDLVHLGLGSDGHTASLLPGDPAVGELRRYVALTELYGSGESMNRRLTLTRPVLDRSRMILWLISGASKGPMLKRLLDGDMSIPAGLIHPPHSVVVADHSAARAVHDRTDDDDHET